MEFLDAARATAEGRRRRGRVRQPARPLRPRPGPGAGRQDAVVGDAPCPQSRHNLTFGGNHINFGSVASAPNVSDLDRGRRPGNFADYCDLLRLAQSLNVIQFVAGYPVEPSDLPPATRHLDAHHARDHAHRHRVWHPLARPPAHRRRDRDDLHRPRHRRERSCARGPASSRSSTPTRRCASTAPMLRAMIEMARANQPIVVTPFTLGGAMAPATIAGALAQQNAEALAGIAFMPDGAAGRPGDVWRLHLQRRHEERRAGLRDAGICPRPRWPAASSPAATSLPYRSSNACAANAVDAQAAYESEMSLWGAVMGGANMIMHGAGWMEGGLVRLVREDDRRRRDAADDGRVPAAASSVDDDTLALRRHHRGRAGRALLRRRPHAGALRDRLLRADPVRLAQLRDLARGRRRTPRQRANAIWKQLLADYQQPPLDPADRRGAEGLRRAPAARRRRQQLEGLRATPPPPRKRDSGPHALQLATRPGFPLSRE